MAMTEKQAAAKEWLNRNFCKHEELQALYMKLDDMRAGSVKAVAAPAEGEKVQTQPNPKSGENYILSIVTFEEMIKQKERQLHLSDLETARTIDKLTSAAERAVLIYRYLCYLHWPEIARKMAYCERRCHELHDDALAHIAELINYTVT